jgi:hypothetical protein
MLDAAREAIGFASGRTSEDLAHDRMLLLSLVNCVECQGRSFLPVTDQAIPDLFQGRHVIGVYPLLPDGNCRFLAVDFDKLSWPERETGGSNLRLRRPERSDAFPDVRETASRISGNWIHGEVTSEERECSDMSVNIDMRRHNGTSLTHGELLPTNP